MIRPTTASLYWCHNCLKRPYLVITLLGLVLIFIFIHQQYSSYGDLELDSESGAFISGQSNRLRFRHNDRRDRSNNYDDDDGGKHNSQTDDLQLRIEDLKRIKLSVINELKSMQRDKLKLQQEKTNLANKNEKLLTLISRSKAQLKQLELDISANRRQKFEKNCDINRVAPIIFNPMKSIDIGKELAGLANHSNLFHYDLINPSSYSKRVSKQQHYNFDLSLCPISREFRFHLVVGSVSNRIQRSDFESPIDSPVIEDILRNHRQYTKDPDEACLIVYISDAASDPPILDATRNNLVLIAQNNYNGTLWRDSAAIASAVFPDGTFRDSIDLILPSVWREPSSYDTIISSMPPQSPIDRKYLASYFGFKTGESNSSHSDAREKILQVIHRNSIDDLFLFMYDCGLKTNTLCYDEKEKLIELSSFLVILHDTEFGVSEHTNEMLYLALSRGSIPVLIGRENLRLPFDEVIDWSRAALLMHTQRLPELHFILRSFNPADLYQMKYHGRRIFENYLATTKQIVDTTISIISIKRLNHNPPPIENVETLTHHRDSELIFDTNCTTAVCQDTRANAASNLLLAEMLGPREKPFASQSFRRNFSLIFNSAYDIWNSPFYSPFHLYPSLPQDPIPPSEHKFISLEPSYRPINEGLGGSGNEFVRSLGGDHPNEQFTIVLLTYERIPILMRTLERLKGLSYLNKILIVWNGVNQPPAADLVWPEVGVPVELVKVDQNSLNNRFLPYDAIETDAILSLDDDSPLRPDEIVFGFRVWRQSRDRIVGFPGRFHAWDSSQGSWMYNSNHSCELSMVLTGGAFFHKYYSYVYTYNMPQTIRSIVDKFMNCEDIAMNFLVAHLTRKPPIKVTSRWTFHCPGCQSSLSEDDSHFRERHECLNTFASIYGYMPLLNTQHRSDSVLFKTRLPHDKQKCFKFV